MAYCRLRRLVPAPWATSIITITMLNVLLLCPQISRHLGNTKDATRVSSPATLLALSADY
jgi:hypothetical protein